MTDCRDCKHLICHAGSKDRYGVPQEPDDYECNSEEATEEDIDNFFCNGLKWDECEDGCNGFERADWGEYED